jgi:hypothetical protein
VRNRQRAGEIGEEDRARLERRDQQRLQPRIRLGERGADLGDAPGDFLPGQVDLPDRVPLRRQVGC